MNTINNEEDKTMKFKYLVNKAMGAVTMPKKEDREHILCASQNANHIPSFLSRFVKHNISILKSLYGRGNFKKNSSTNFFMESTLLTTIQHFVIDVRVQKKSIFPISRNRLLLSLFSLPTLPLKGV